MHWSPWTSFLQDQHSFPARQAEQRSTCGTIDLVDDDAVGSPRAYDGLHLHRVADARSQRGGRALVAGVDLHGAVAAVPRHHMRQRRLAQPCTTSTLTTPKWCLDTTSPLTLKA